MTREHTGECAVVAGATGALGMAIVQRLLDAGLTVVGVARSADQLAGCPGVVPVVGDLGDDAVTEAVASAVDGPVRMLVQAAGLPASGTVDTLTGAEIARGMDVKLGGFLRLIHAVESRFASNARIVVLGGHYGFEPSPAVPLAGMANAALMSLVRSLADRWGPAGVTVHLVAPGPVESPRMQAIAERTAAQEGGVTTDVVLDRYRAGSPLGRLTTIDEVAWAVGILLAPEAAALHGSTLSLDAGRRRGIG
jgi:NAD(P)-dependent dehydrogenase (short-subunit alcohol dehydrogenase family)